MIATVTATQHWVRLERQYHPDMFIGPFSDEGAAGTCMDHSQLVDQECHRDCLELYLTTDQPGESAEVVLVDHSDPAETGVPYPLVLEAATAANSACPDCGAPVHTGYRGLPDGDVEPWGECTNVRCSFAF